jgi:hypothetical protein
MGKAVPFPFIVEALDPVHPLVKPMFSGFAVYVADKIVFMLRDRPTLTGDNGLWFVFSEEADMSKKAGSLRSEFPSLREIGLLEGKISHWMVLPVDAPDFESAALRACDLVLAHDPRLGRVPKSRKAEPARRRAV